MTFNGTWKVDRNDNYEKFMEQMGINVVKRKMAEHDNLKITIEQNGDKFHIKESSTFRTKDIDFTLGVPFDYSLADGTEVSVSFPKSCRSTRSQTSGYMGDGGRHVKG
ncbi:fatty acid-binding protein, intestinal-like [Solea senegalensis]|uniref:Fatty acid-binding protein, intestinal-like n=1 Tax=Solea senegalensis TaxID=28829 RepID=A0AAV6QVF6_SOLSE|nr:fatty acid-binding protein, intestinal-like [Solea senegalensis]